MKLHVQGTSAIEEQYSIGSALDFQANIAEIGGIWCEIDCADFLRNRGVPILFQPQIMSCMSVVIALQCWYLMQLSYQLEINYPEKRGRSSIRVHKLLANKA